MNFKDHKRLSLLAFLLVVCVTQNTWVNAQETRSLIGEIQLDVGPANRDLAIDISVRNHSFVVLPPPLGIIRPIQSKVTTRVQIPTGEFSTQYEINGILENPVDYTVQINCVACDDIVPTQYYALEGNRFVLGNSSYIDPNDLPQKLNLTALSLANISGQIDLLNPSNRDLDLKIEVADDSYPQSILASDGSIKIVSGTHQTNYQITGLSRSVEAYRVNFECLNCFGQARNAQVYSSPLPSSENHTDINFTLIDQGLNIITPVINLLLDDPKHLL